MIAILKLIFCIFIFTSAHAQECNSIKIVGHGGEYILTPDECVLVSKMLQPQEKGELRKILCQYKIQVYYDNIFVTYKTNGVYFAKVGTDFFYKFSNDIRYIFQKASYKSSQDEGKMLLKCDDIRNFDIQELDVDGKKLLKISGLCGHSSYVVKKIYITIEDDSLIINIEASFFKKKNETGFFEYDICIPDDVNQVLIGDTKKEIWSRN